MGARPVVAIPTTLVTGAAAAREEAIASLLAVPAFPGKDGGFSAVILEGLPSGSTPIPDISSVRLVRLAVGCPCCAGSLVLRVTLNRLLRQGPERLFIGLADSQHLDQLRSWLQDAPYDQLLALGPDVHA